MAEEKEEPPPLEKTTIEPIGYLVVRKITKDGKSHYQCDAQLQRSEDEAVMRNAVREFIGAAPAWETTSFIAQAALGFATTQDIDMDKAVRWAYGLQGALIEAAVERTRKAEG